MDNQYFKATERFASLQDSVSFFLSQHRSDETKRGGSTSSSKDETETFGMEASEGSISVDEDEFGYMDRHPSKMRKRRADRMSLAILVGFCLVMFGAIVPLSRRKRKGHALTTQNDESAKNGSTSKQETQVFCDGDGPYRVDEWMQQDFRLTRTVDLCDPDFRPGSNEADLSKSVKVFILLGESNMVGAGQKRGKVEGTLEYTVMNEKKFTHLVDSNQEWRTRPDVRYVAVKNDMNVERNEWLGPSSDHFFFGPELQLGYILGELYEEPVLLLKAASGHHSLGGDLLPPGSPEHKYGEWIYPGYGGTPRRWPYYADPTSQTTWYAGHAYDTTISNIQSILERIGDFYPRAIDYKIEGIAIWQGDSDQRDSAYSSMYQRNLRNLIASLRIDLQAPNAKVAIASIGQKGQAMDGNALEVYESQMLMGSLYEDFQGNVMSIDIRSSWRGPFLPGHYGNSSMMDTAHYGNNAETVMEVGNALGLALAKLLHGVA